MDEQELDYFQKSWPGNYAEYFFGYSASIFFTLVAFFLVVTGVFSKTMTVVSILGLALLQAITQVLFFLHLGKETRPYWKLFIFLCMLTFLIIVISGSLWIMFDLESRVMSNM